MSEEKTENFTTALLLLCPLALITFMDLFSLFLQPHTKAISHLAFGVLVSQLLCNIVFLKGQICPGQRGRLSTANLSLLLFWAIWLCLSLFSNYHYILTDMICLAGITVAFINRQQTGDRLSHSMVKMSNWICLVAMLGYVAILGFFPKVNWVEYNPWILYNLFAQGLFGVILANLLLQVARNRLQGFITLLSHFMGGLLFLNALVVCLFLAIAYWQSPTQYANKFAFPLYFALHFIMLVIIGIAIWRKQKLSYLSLVILLTISASLPMWASFAYWVE